ncbi:hypothetical protein V5799_021587 [Amblyomma americanum]|uniref:Uncharacterized protein n=1 Tax=Amblyomma americanum TaxID=6943 RepID=A0AAQ4FMV0_AMBAM
MAAAPSKKPVLVKLDMEYAEGGSSPWFNSKGRSLVAGLTSEPPGNADLFSELARDGSMAALVGYLDAEQSSVSNVALLCYILLGLVLLELFVQLPLAACCLRRYTAAVGLVPWLVCQLVVLCCASVQLLSLLTMISTWYGMDDGLRAKTPQAYEWTFELLHNYSRLTAEMLRETKQNVDKALEATTSSIQWLRGNMSAWEDKFAGYAALKHMVTGPLSLVQMAVLGLALAITLASSLVACGAWNRRLRNLEKGGRSPVFVAAVVMAGAVLLLAHLLLVLPMIARWLPVCVLADTYFCRPYRSGAFAVLDDAVARVWPPANRPEPFCRLVPSALIGKCATKDKVGIKSLPLCPVEADRSKDAAKPKYLRLQQPPARTTAAATAEKPVGDCFYPYKIIDTDMTSACPLFTDELVGHWMAMVFAAAFGMLGAPAAGAIAVVFLAVGESGKSLSTRKTVHIRIRKKRRKRKKPSKKDEKATSQPLNPLKTPAPPPPPPAPLPPTPEPLNVGLEVQVPMPVVVRRPKRRRLPEPIVPIIVMAPPPCLSRRSRSLPPAALMALPVTRALIQREDPVVPTAVASCTCRLPANVPGRAALADSGVGTDDGGTAPLNSARAPQAMGHRALKSPRQKRSVSFYELPRRTRDSRSATVAGVAVVPSRRFLQGIVRPQPEVRTQSAYPTRSRPSGRVRRRAECDVYDDVDVLRV